MCYIFREDEINLIQAEEDVPVFKLGISDDNYFMSYPRKAMYKFGEANRAEKFWEKFRKGKLEGELITETGLYSIEDEKAAECYFREIIRNTLLCTPFKSRLFKAIIPKGSFYLRTKDGFCISDALIVLNETLDYYPKLSKEFLETCSEYIKSYVPENIISGS